MMRGIWGRALVVSSLFLLAAAAVALADARQEFAQETGLDPSLIGVVQTSEGGTEMTIVFVFVDARALDSRVSPALRATLLPYVGRNALYVNPSIRSVVAQSSFDPQQIAVESAGTGRWTPPLSAWNEVTPGFLSGAFAVNPAGPTQGSGSEGVLVLGDAVDPDKPFTVAYGASSATFDLASVTQDGASAAGSTAALSHPPIDVPPLEDVSSLEAILARPDVTADSLGVLLGLDRALVRVLDLTMSSKPIRMVFVRLEDSVRASSLGPDVLSRLEPVIGTGAVMVWALSAVGAPFSPWYFYIQQAGTNYVFFSAASFVELTDGFLDLTHLAPGVLAAAVIRLPRGVAPAQPFTVRYSTFGASYP